MSNYESFEMASSTLNCDQPPIGLNSEEFSPLEKSDLQRQEGEVSGGESGRSEQRIDDSSEVCDGAFVTTITAEAKSPRTPSEETLIGRQFAGFEVISELGRGGMGVVYKARQPRLDRFVALKVIHPRTQGSRESVEQFHAEAEAIAQLNHPNIVSIYDIGGDQGVHYFSMELIDGPDLQAQCRNQPPNRKSVAELVQTIATAVGYAHGLGIVHRDLKPHNVLIAPDGQPKIADFGLAMRLESCSLSSVAGQIVGTPGYMSPEQADGRVADTGPLSDVYSIGAILYFMLTGKPPFSGKRPAETIQQVIRESPVSPRSLNPAIDLDLEAICLKCLKKNSKERYQSALELADDLGRYRAGKPIAARKIPIQARIARWCRRNRLVSTILFLMTASITVAAVVGFQFTSQRTEFAQTHKKAVRLEKSKDLLEKNQRDLDRKLSNTERNLRTNQFWSTVYDTKEKLSAALKPGEMIRMVADLKRVQRYAPNEVAVKEHRSVLARCLSRMDFDVTHSLRVSTKLRMRAIAFNSTGDRMAVAGKSLFAGIHIFDTKNGSLERILPYPLRTRAAATLAFHPGNRWLAAGTKESEVLVWDLSQPRPSMRLIGRHGDDIVKLAFSGDGRTLYSSSNDRSVKAWDVSDDWKLKTTFRTPAVSDMAVYDTRIAVGSTERGLHIIEVEKTAATRLTNWKEPWLRGGTDAVAFSPKGRRLAMTHYGTILIMDPDKPAQARWFPSRRSKAHTEQITHLQFSLDGTLLLSSSVDRSVKLWDIASGRLLVSFVLENHRDLHSAQFTPDGRNIAWTQKDYVVICPIRRPDVCRVVGTGEPAAVRITFSAKSDRVACLSGRKLSVWDCTNGELESSTEQSEPGLPDVDRQALCYTASGRISFTTRSPSHYEIREWKPNDSAPSWRLASISSGQPDSPPMIRGIRPGSRGSLEFAIQPYANGYMQFVSLDRSGSGRKQIGSWFLKRPEAVRCAQLDSSTPTAIVGTNGGVIYYGRMATQHPRELARYAAPISAVDVSSSAGVFIVAVKQTVHIVPLNHSRHDGLSISCRGLVREARISRDGRFLAIAVENEHGVRLWNLERLKSHLEYRTDRKPNGRAT